MTPRKDIKDKKNYITGNLEERRKLLNNIFVCKGWALGN